MSTPSLIFAFWVECIATSPNEAKRHAEEVLALSSEHGFSHWRGWGLIHLGWSLTALGQAREGLPLISGGLDELRATGAVTSTPFALISLAEGYANVRQFTEGLN